MNLAARDIRHNLGRFVLTTIGVGMLLMVVMGMGGIYRGLSFFDTLMTLPGEPNGVVVSSATPAQRARVSPLPAGRFLSLLESSPLGRRLAPWLAR